MKNTLNDILEHPETSFDVNENCKDIATYIRYVE